MAFEEGLNMVWVLILVIAFILVTIGLYMYFRPGVQGGWLTNLASAFKWLALPP